MCPDGGLRADNGTACTTSARIRMTAPSDCCTVSLKSQVDFYDSALEYGKDSVMQASRDLQCQAIHVMNILDCEAGRCPVYISGEQRVQCQSYYTQHTFLSSHTEGTQTTQKACAERTFTMVTVVSSSSVRTCAAGAATATAARSADAT